MLLHALASLGKDVKELKEMINNQSVQQQSQPIYQQQSQPIYQQQSQPIYQDTEISVAPRTDYSVSPRIEQQVTPQVREPEVIPDAVEYVEAAPRSMKEIEEMQIREALHRNHYNRSKTARELGISERTLYRRIKDYGLEK
jgi:DNA-binding NtrC family response regulator